MFDEVSINISKPFNPTSVYGSVDPRDFIEVFLVCSLRNLRNNSFVELNLTTWYKRVAEGKSLDAPRLQLRLAGNQIHRIISPSLHTLESKIVAPLSLSEQLLSIQSPQTFIL